MKRVPPGLCSASRCAPAELGEHCPRPIRPKRGEARGRGQRHVRTWVQPKQPEQPRGLDTERPIRPREDGPDVRGRVPHGKGSRACDASLSSLAMTASGKLGAVAARAAAIVKASGSRAHRLMMASTAAGSREIRSRPRRRFSSSRASTVVSRSSVSDRAPSAATRPARWSRLVAIATHPGEPGSSGRT